MAMGQYIIVYVIPRETESGMVECTDRGPKFKCMCRQSVHALPIVVSDSTHTHTWPHPHWLAIYIYVELYREVELLIYSQFHTERE